MRSRPHFPKSSESHIYRLSDNNPEYNSKRRVVARRKLLLILSSPDYQPPKSWIRCWTDRRRDSLRSAGSAQNRSAPCRTWAQADRAQACSRIRHLVHTPRRQWSMPCPGGWITSTPRCTIFGIYPNPDARVEIRFPFLETLAQNTFWPPRNWSVWSGRESWAKSPFELMWPSRNAITTNAPPLFSMVSCRVASFSLISGMKSRE